jgi:hypothetical protein
MKKLTVLVIASAIALTGCNMEGKPNQNSKDKQAVEMQQSQYAASQPVPAYDWSLERHLVIELYNVRNMRAATHSVWRSDLGTIEGDCPSIGFGIPYDTSLTNPLMSEWRFRSNSGVGGVSIEQPEPNGIYASKNTAATWVMCVGESGAIEPVYVEAKVTSYPYSVSVNYDKNRVIKSGNATVTIK